MELPALIPVITVEDIRSAIVFYGRLGFVEEKEYTFAGDDGTVVHAQMRKNGSVFFLGKQGMAYYKGARADQISSSKPSQRGLGVTFILQTDDLERILKIVKDEKLTLLYGPADEWYGDKVFLFLDPFRYEWKVSQPHDVSGVDNPGQGVK